MRHFKFIAYRLYKYILMYNHKSMVFYDPKFMTLRASAWIALESAQ